MRRAFRLPTTSERIARELDDEVRFHVEMRAKKLIESGYSIEDAYAEALRRFGDVDDLRDYCVSIEVAHMQRVEFRERFHSLMQDCRFALRQFRKAPGFAFIAALTLALGVGATTAIFSVVSGVILRPLPFDDSERMVYISGVDAKGQPLNNTADPTFDAILDANRSFEALAEYQQGTIPIISDGEATRARTASVSRGYFDVLHVKPAAGRFFLPDEQQLGASPVAIISDGFWERQFARAPSVIGRRIETSNGPVTIIGVLPPAKEFPAETDMLFARETRPKNTSYTAHNFRVIGRLKPGVSLQLANQDLSAILRNLHARVGDLTWTVDGGAKTLREQVIGNITPLLVLVFSASALLLIIASANVANLLIARMATRENEIAVRVAIGAGRARLVQQLLIESGMLAAVGCACGLLLAFGGMKVLLALRPTSIPRVNELTIDWRVMTFAIAVSAATAVTLGLVAAWRGARGDLRAALAQSQRTQGGGGASYRIRGTLVVVQIAMTVVLLIGAGLLARSFINLLNVDAGFRTKGVVVVSAAASSGDGPGAFERRLQYINDAAERARSLPGVTAVGISSAPPFYGGSSNGLFLVLAGSDVKLEMQALSELFRDKSHTGQANYQQATEGYFKALNIPLLSGRYFDDRDRRDAPHVAVVSQSLAKSQWPNESALGKVIEFGNIDGDMTPMTIVGVVGDTHEQSLTSPGPNTVYVSALQRPSSGDVNIVMATSNETVTAAAARRALHDYRSDVALRFQMIEEIIARSVATQRFMLLLVGVFGIVALLLATLGVYSVISYLVAQRSREISIRVALGARAADIVRLVIGQGVTLALIGAVVGAVAAVAATRVLKKLLYGISTTDPIAFVTVLTMLCAVAALASYLPARRAARTEPMDILRGG